MIASLPTRRRAAFTMIELLIAIAVVGIMASAMLASMAALLEEGKIARTKSQIARIDMLIAERWESYRTRPAPVAIPATATAAQRIDPRYRGALRLAAIRELMRMEMPERINDIADAPVSLPSVPSLTRRYRQKIASVVGGTSTSPNYAAWSAPLSRFESAECLYLILQSMPDGDGNGLDFFTPPEIGDVDGDGMKEVLDAWGTPIGFFRWAPGFESDRQQFANAADPDRQPYDPFDPSKVAARWRSPSNAYLPTQPFPMFPLIFSGGPDRVWGLEENTGLHFNVSSSTAVANDPYTNNSGLNGTPTGSDHYDNIHNHLLEVN